MAKEAIKDKPESSIGAEKRHRIKIKCPYCDKPTIQKMSYSMTDSLPNFLACPECKYHFIAIQKTNINILIVEIQDEIDKMAGKYAQSPDIEQTKL